MILSLTAVWILKNLKNWDRNVYLKNPGEKCIDNHLMMDKFKVDSLRVVCDVIISEQRFGDSDGLLKVLSTKRPKEVRKNLKLILVDAFNGICFVYKKYFDRTMLVAKYKQSVQNLEVIEITRKLSKTLYTVYFVKSYDVEDSDQCSLIDSNLEGDDETIDVNTFRDEY